MKRESLIEAVAEIVDLNKACTGRVVDAVFDQITCSLIENDSVTISGFGTFSVKARAAKMGRNPHTGEAIEIAACRVPHFKAASKLKGKVNVGEVVEVDRPS